MGNYSRTMDLYKMSKMLIIPQTKTQIRLNVDDFLGPYHLTSPYKC